MAGKTKVLLDITEYILDMYGNEIPSRRVEYHFTYDMPDKYFSSVTALKRKAIEVVLNKIGKRHHVFVMLSYLEPSTLERKVVNIDFKPRKVDFDVPKQYTSLNSYGKKTPSDKPRKSAGETFDNAMKKGMAGFDKAKGYVNKGLDWFYMEGDFAYLREKKGLPPVGGTKQVAPSKASVPKLPPATTAAKKPKTPRKTATVGRKTTKSARNNTKKQTFRLNGVTYYYANGMNEKEMDEHLNKKYRRTKYD